MPTTKEETIGRTILKCSTSLLNSLQGYEDAPKEYTLDEQLKGVFKNISTCFEVHNEPISFISFADSELKSKKMADWEVEPDKGHFFYAPIINDLDSKKKNKNDFLINDYYYFKSILSDTAPAGNWPVWATEQERNLLSTPKSAQLAYVLEDAFVYRIRCAKRIRKPTLSYDCGQKVLVVTIPHSWLDFHGKPRKRSNTYTPIEFNSEEFQYSPRENGANSKKKGDKPYPSGKADTGQLKARIETTSNLLRKAKIPLKQPDSNKKKDIYADGFSRLILSLAYLSKLLDCWVESIPCAVNVMGGKPRCLGVFIWGYYGESPESPYSIYFQQLSDKICTCFASQYIQPLKNAQEVKEKATAAAIAQAMARNLSHNHGSHVMSDLIGDLVYDRLTDDAIKNEKKAYVSSISEDKDVFDEKNKQIAYFSRYLKNRMDYLSEVTFGVSTLLTTKMVKSDVLVELDRVRILLNRISGVSGFSFTIVLKFEGTLKNESDIGVSLPGDILGCQAFYNILENIIRNTAKHAARKSPDQKQVTFTVCFKDITPQAGGKSADADALYCVEIDNGTDERDIDTLVDNQNRLLNESVLDEYNNLRSHGLGLLEMKASAAFLRQIDLLDIDSRDYQVDSNEEYYHAEHGKHVLNILKAFAIKEKDENGAARKTKAGKLGYRLFVQKPKEILFIGEPKDWGATASEGKTLLNLGIQFKDESGFQSCLREGVSFSHRFLICQEDRISETTRDMLGNHNDCKTLLPLRKLFLDETRTAQVRAVLSEEPRQKTLSDLMQLAWEKQMESLEIDKDSIFIGPLKNDDKHQVVFLNHSHEMAYDGLMEEIGKNTDCKVANVWVDHVLSHTVAKLPQYPYLSVPTIPGAHLTPFQTYLWALLDSSFIRYELLEAYLYPVIVLDERVQKYASENREGVYHTNPDGTVSKPIPCMKLHASSNVLIPEKEAIPLSPNDFKEEYKQHIIDFVRDRLTVKSHGPHPIILVHYGILERMFGGDTVQITQLLDDWSAQALRVVVTSGRGAHSLPLPPSVCYVNLSSVLNVFNENRLKYLVHYLMSQSRRKNSGKADSPIFTNRTTTES
jgi:hypothetical protein